MATEKTLQIKVSVPAGANANTILMAKIIEDPKKGEQSEILVPKGEIWIIDDIYITSTPSIDVMLYFYKNDRKLMTSTPPVSTLKVDNPARPTVQPIGYMEHEKLTVQAVNLAANSGTSAVDITVYAHVKVLVEGEDY